MDESDDIALLDAWALGDRAAGAKLFERHLESLQRFFFAKVPHAADDLVQATLLACIEGRTRLQDRASFRAFLLGIARNQLYNYYRKRRSERERRPENTTSRYHRGPSPSTFMIMCDADRAVLEAMRALPLSMRVLLELAYWEDLSPVELAQALELPLNAVHSRLHRARRRLRELLCELDAEAQGQELQSG